MLTRFILGPRMTRLPTILVVPVVGEEHRRYAQSLRGSGFELAPPLRGLGEIGEAIRSGSPETVVVDLDAAPYEGRRLVQGIREVRAVPILLTGRITELGPEPVLDALAAGATDFLEKDPDSHPPETGLDPDRLADRLRLVTQPLFGRPRPPRAARPAAPKNRADTAFPIIVIGVSMGGPAALEHFLPQLPADLPAALVVVQHMPAPFTETLARRLAEVSAIRVREAVQGDAPVPGQALFAPGGRHVDFAAKGTVNLRMPTATSRFVPCIDVTLLSAARVFGSRTIAVILTGMGKDGVVGLRQVAISGGRTVAQDSQSAVVDGMPGAAARGGYVHRVVPLGEMGEVLVRLSRGTVRC